MRAMPSPTCRIVPTLSTSSSWLYCFSSCDRTELISSGRSFTAGLLVRAASSRIGFGSGGEGGSHELLAHLVEGGADAAVDHAIAHDRDDTPDDARVDTR